MRFLDSIDTRLMAIERRQEEMENRMKSLKEALIPYTQHQSSRKSKKRRASPEQKEYEEEHEESGNSSESTEPVKQKTRKEENTLIMGLIILLLEKIFDFWTYFLRLVLKEILQTMKPTPNDIL